jgi:hypothetical protein
LGDPLFADVLVWAHPVATSGIGCPSRKEAQECRRIASLAIFNMSFPLIAS